MVANIKYYQVKLWQCVIQYSMVGGQLFFKIVLSFINGVEFFWEFKKSVMNWALDDFIETGRDGNTLCYCCGVLLYQNLPTHSLKFCVSAILFLFFCWYLKARVIIAFHKICELMRKVISNAAEPGFKIKSVNRHTFCEINF